MTVIEERQPLLGSPNPNPTSGSEERDDLERGDSRSGGGDEGEVADLEALTWRERTAEKLEAPSTHKAIILLVAIDACCVLADLVYTFLSPERECPNALAALAATNPGSEPVWLTTLAHISLTINTLFLLEIPLALWCFGVAYYNPLPKSLSLSSSDEKHPYAGLHLFDALVVITTFVLEVVLRGREAELAGLLVLLRLWRLVKLVGGLAVGAGELQEELSNQLAETQRLLQEEQARASRLEEENTSLRARLADMEQTSQAKSDSDSIDVERWVLVLSDSEST
ncbi:hypothetical protein A7U60_g8933 [Sanghuangporus baumii]|uniref:Hydrogen voltage-gated channel 1 n=1 Tax=Sanghuangporus baumii TaxID=108892 RepID=A0A9Q5MXV3_SANBA|nr:hypothetical protein A7U60_g8933 [Sanghuangporus baumii]